MEPDRVSVFFYGLSMDADRFGVDFLTITSRIAASAPDR
jgi:hypothetical protein